MELVDIPIYTTRYIWYAVLDGLGVAVQEVVPYFGGLLIERGNNIEEAFWDE